MHVIRVPLLKAVLSFYCNVSGDISHLCMGWCLSDDGLALDVSKLAVVVVV